MLTAEVKQVPLMNRGNIRVRRGYALTAYRVKCFFEQCPSHGCLLFPKQSSAGLKRLLGLNQRLNGQGMKTA
jgi:hypothetical protein